MKELAEKLHFSSEEECSELREASKKWAGYCLESLDGELLDKGLRVSAAIAEFLNERERID